MQTPVSEARVCLPIVLSDGIKVATVEDRPDPDDWKKLPAVHCQATQSVLTFLCSLNGQSRKVRFEKFDSRMEYRQQLAGRPLRVAG
jgi:hypothetical protein